MEGQFRRKLEAKIRHLSVLNSETPVPVPEVAGGVLQRTLLWAWRVGGRGGVVSLPKVSPPYTKFLFPPPN
jgi:hypothetical protein